MDSAPGQGSTFWFEVSCPCGTATGDWETPQPPADRRALYITPPNLQAAFVRQYLDEWGVDYGVAESVEEGLRLAGAGGDGGHPYQVALLDDSLIPAGDAQAWQAMQARCAADKILLVELSHAGSAGTNCRGAQAHLLKPIQRSQLHAILSAPESNQTRIGKPAVAAADSAPASLSGRVLLVEDNEVNRVLAIAMLEKLGLACTVAEDGKGALESLAEQAFDLVLMDCQMPEMDGLEATQAIRERERAAGKSPLPIIALTAHAMEGDRERCIAVGMSDYLSKPFTLDGLRSALSRWLKPAQA